MTAPASSRFVGNTVALAVSTVLATVLTLAQMKILAAHLSMEMFGLFASLRGLALLVSMLAANGFPQVLVRYLPAFAARGERASAFRTTAIAIGGSLVLCAVQIAVLVALAGVFFRQAPGDEPLGPLLIWFGVTSVGVSLKLVLYGGFNGLRRFESQTVLEVASLAVQVAWMASEARDLTLVRLFEIVGATSLATAVVALPWYAWRLGDDVARSDAAPAEPRGAVVSYWWGAVGLSVVALAFTDVDRWVLSNVLALEALSLFHVASRITRLANRFIAIPVLAFQPEATRVHAEGRRELLDISARVFFKASVLLATFACAAIVVYADSLIRLASSGAYLGARTTLWLLAASIPLTAMTAPLTAVMKALDGVRAALYCDLAWATVYVGLLLVLAAPAGVAGAGLAQLAACGIQLVLAVRLARLRPSVSAMGVALGKSMLCAVAVFTPVVALRAAGIPGIVTMALAIPALAVYARLARWMSVFAADERERLHAMTWRRLPVAAVSRWMP